MKEYLPGLRIIKTSLAVFICLALFHVFGYYRPIHAVISCVLMLKESSDETLFAGKNRIVGTILGGVVSWISLVIIMESEIPETSYLFPLILSMSVFCTLAICKIFKLDSYVASMASVVILITLLGSVDSHKGVFVYVLVRTVQTLIGIIIAFIINTYVNFGYQMPEKE